MEEIAGLEEWVCPKCRGICNCSVCMKRRGHQPTTILINAAKETRFSSVSEMLLKSAERLNHENVCTGTNMCFTVKRGKENSFDGQLDAHLPESTGKKFKGLLNGKAVDNTTSDICNQDPDMIVLNQEGLKGNGPDQCGWN
ncbi:Zinc-finger domain of monoamine-oxidase A repressor R1 protein [Perilla frutescens var. hirtella]|uniref:Zinc-finger domain of monoamine-oxidase A repressor R1 protein n=1 Tax=Perilla frutescens var. hirtella TaxID=608512 RepID=A0AAD4IUK6_PERFH|nr:Zinc-finger domain of monoamine-oxidase A repressor R1 protein [Perilla frutescens var. hirtella]